MPQRHCDPTAATKGLALTGHYVKFGEVVTKLLHPPPFFEPRF